MYIILCVFRFSETYIFKINNFFQFRIVNIIQTPMLQGHKVKVDLIIYLVGIYLYIYIKCRQICTIFLIKL